MMEGLDSVEVAPSKMEGDGGTNYAAEEQLWRHEFFRDCMAPKQAKFKVTAPPPPPPGAPGGATPIASC